MDEADGHTGLSGEELPTADEPMHCTSRPNGTFIVRREVAVGLSIGSFFAVHYRNGCVHRRVCNRTDCRSPLSTTFPEGLNKLIQPHLENGRSVILRVSAIGNWFHTIVDVILIPFKVVDLKRSNTLCMQIPPIWNDNLTFHDAAVSE